MIDFPNDKTQRQTLTIKLYYRILEAILLAEETRLKKEKGVSEVNFTVLLNNDKFHKSLLACCLEIVIVSHKIVEMTFPHSLHLLELQPFDFCKVIETVVKHEPTLPSVVIKHLVSIEERILESMAWEGDSPLFTALTAEQREAFLMRLQESGSPQKPSQSACLLFASPMKPKNAPPSTPMRPSNPSVELFFRKVAYLASLRIIKLCADLQDEGTIRITDRLERQMEYAFVYTLIQHTEIMQNRHIDQIIMCVLYAICKLNEISITFKAIVDKYHRQPQANSRVYKNIRLNERETGDIIQFYNTIFIPQLEYFLLRFRTVSTPEKVAIIGANNSSGGSVGNDDDDDSGNSATPSYLRVLSPFVFKQKSPQKLQNIMISPRRTPLLMGGDKNKFSNSISYQFGVSPAKDLEQINKSVNKDSVRRQLNFDKANTEEATKENERNLKRKQEEAELVASVFEGMQSQTVSKADETNRQPMKKQRK
jgi:retinoblastoma-like protein 1